MSSSKRALVFVFITVLIDIIGVGITIPVAPQLISQLSHTDLSDAARYGGLLMFVFAGMQFLFSPIVGNLSDRYGRKPLLIFSLLMLGCDFVITGLAPNIFWLFLGRILSGIAGASFTIAKAYIADVSPPEKRGANFGMIGAAFGIGFTIGPALGGILGHIWIRLPFFFSAALALCNAIYGICVLKESLPPEKRRPFEWRRANPLGALKALKRYPFLFGLAGVLVLMRIAQDSNASVWTYFTMYRFHWSIRDVGISLMVMGLLSALAYGGIVRKLIPRIGEVRSVYLGLSCGVIGFLGYAFSTAGWQMYIWMVVFTMMALTMPSLNALMSRFAGDREQGELQGALTSLGSLTSVFAPLAMTNLFSWFTGPNPPLHFPGVSYLAAALCLLAAMVTMVRVVSKHRWQLMRMQVKIRPRS